MLQQVKKTYGERIVLDVEELQLESGGFFGIIGQNGAGKSTLLNIVAGIEPSTSGQVFYGCGGAGSNCGDAQTPDFKRMTLVTQHPYLIRTTVEKNIAYPLKLRGWDKKAIQERVEGLIGELGLSHIAKQKSWKLSAGEGQKVALARALSFDPEVLLLDEPTANIDPGAVLEIEEILRKKNRENRITVAIITHNLAQARRLCDQILFLHQGKLAARGAGKEFFSTPENPLAAEFIAGELI